MMPSNWDHFRRAVSVLVGPGPIKQRLAEAYLGHLRSVDARALPSSVMPDFLALSDALSSTKATGGMNAVEVSVRKMSEQEAGRHATSVLEMFIALEGGEALEPSAAHARQLRVVGDDDEIPAFLNRA
jgi:hypothetical protein